MCQIVGKELADLGSGVVDGIAGGFITRQVAKRINPPVTFGDTPHSNCTSEPDIDKPYSSSDLCIANVIFVFNNFLLNIPSDIIKCSDPNALSQKKNWLQYIYQV